MKKSMIMVAVVAAVLFLWIGFAGGGMGGLMLITALMSSSRPVVPQIGQEKLDSRLNPNRWVNDPNSKSRWCMLMHAVQYGTAEDFRQLLRNGADAKRCEGGADALLDTILFKAAIGRFRGNKDGKIDEEFIDAFRSFKIRPENVQRFLAEAARRQSIAGVTFAVRNLGADVNQVGETGNTPLHLAVWGEWPLNDHTVRIVDALIGLGADPNVGTSSETTALARVRARVDKDERWSRIESAMLRGNQEIGLQPQRKVDQNTARIGGSEVPIVAEPRK